MKFTLYNRKKNNPMCNGSNRPLCSPAQCDEFYVTWERTHNLALSFKNTGCLQINEFINIQLFNRPKMEYGKNCVTSPSKCGHLYGFWISLKNIIEMLEKPVPNHISSFDTTKTGVYYCLFQMKSLQQSAKRAECCFTFNFSTNFAKGRILFQKVVPTKVELIHAGWKQKRMSR